MYYCLRGNESGQILTWNGKPIVHDNAKQLEHLVTNARVIRYGPTLNGEELPLKFHPDFYGKI